jgi:FAD/FMN-containing dehydrogenase
LKDMLHPGKRKELCMADRAHALQMEDLRRREFLKLCGVGALPALSGVLAACQSAQAEPGGPKPTPTIVPTKQAIPTDADWSTLGKSLKGTLIRPDSPQYVAARQLFDPRFDNVRPAAIAYSTAPGDVQACLAFARRFNLSFTTRAGGHSYAGYSTSTGIVIDVTRMSAITVNTDAATATIGAGARLIDVYDGLAQYGMVLPAGSCPTVGIAGLTLGGGAGVLGRKYGLTCDSLLSAQIVLADGRVLTSDASHSADLFWALRGGGGGNFGVVTSFTFRVQPVSRLTLFTLNWPWSSAAAIVDAWQNWAPQAPDELWSNCLLLATANKSAQPIVRVNGVYVGGVGPLDRLLQQFIDRVGSAPTDRYVSAASILDTMLYEASCYGKTVNQCHLPSQNVQGQVQRSTEGAKSDYFTSLLPRQGIKNLVNAIANRQSSSTLGEGGIGLDAYGGAINRVAANATAFAHRNALFSAQYNAGWNVSDSSAVVAANRSWLNGAWQGMRSYASGAAYQNYVDPDLTNWQQAYYGANLTRLQQVKATYDPHNLFHFAQSIPPPS